VRKIIHNFVCPSSSLFLFFFSFCVVCPTISFLSFFTHIALAFGQKKEKKKKRVEKKDPNKDDPNNEDIFSNDS